MSATGIHNATSYQDASFVRPVTARERQQVYIADVPIYGGLAQIDLTAEFHYDNGCLTIDDIELDAFEISGFCDGRDESWFRWEVEQINRWPQKRINEVIEAVGGENAIAERL